MPDHQTSSQSVAYLINQYPKVSHSFIRREILALEAQGITVERIALRGWDDNNLVDAADHAERARTRYVQKNGIGALLRAALKSAITRPKAFWKALGLALAMARCASRPWPYHIIYLAQACRVRDWIAETDATHLHAHFGTNPAEIACLVHALGGPEYSFTIHGQDEIEGAKQLHFDRKIGMAKFAVATSAYCRSQILREIPHANWGKLHIVHCGLEADFFASATAPTKAPRFLSIARLSPEKGHLILMEAFSALRETHADARLVCAGDGPMRPEIEARIAGLDLSDAVTITGWVDAARIRDELEHTRILVQPSFIEGLPVVIMEALARQRPVISTYVAGIPELVRPGENGWLVPAGEVTALAEAMRMALEADDGLLTQMGQAGQARTRARHSIDTETRKLAALFFGTTP